MLRADGCPQTGDDSGSIRKIGAKAHGAQACNGWDFWHVERSGTLVAIDLLRQAYRKVAEGKWPAAEAEERAA